jgi:hypothetical protein
MNQAGLESFGAYQKARELLDLYCQKRISVSPQAEGAGIFSRPFGTWGSRFDAFPGLKAWAIFDCPSGTGQGTGIFSPLDSVLDSPFHEPTDSNTATTSSPRPSPPMEEREKIREVQGRNARSSNVEAFHEPTVADWRNPVGVVDLRHLNPRVASQARQPWALRRNPFGILCLGFKVAMHVPRTLKFSMNRRSIMPLGRSLRRDQGGLAAIDMALLRSFSNRFKVLVHERS